MDKLWSPWRSQYIESFQTKGKNDDCIFCNAKDENESEDRSLIVVKNKLTFTVLNLFPYNNGHLMVVPYRHINDYSALTPDELLEVFNEIGNAVTALKGSMNPEGFNIGANLGKAAGAGIDAHIHFHIVPRWNGDTNFMPALGEVKVISQDLLACKTNLREEYKKLSR